MPPVSLEKHAVVWPQSGDELATVNHRGTTGFRRLAQTAGTLTFDNKKPSDLQFMLKPYSGENCVNLRSPKLPGNPSLVIYGVAEVAGIGF